MTESPIFFPVDKHFLASEEAMNLLANRVGAPILPNAVSLGDQQPVRIAAHMPNKNSI